MAYCIWKSYKLKVDPFEIFSALKNERQCFFLDSSLNADSSLGRYSFIGIDPFYVLKTKNQDPLGKLRELLDRYRMAMPKGSLPFFGGAVGYLAYDLGFILEKKFKVNLGLDSGIPDSVFGFYNTAIVVDHPKQLFYILAVGFPETEEHPARLLCEANIKKVCALISQIAPNRKQAPEDKSKKIRPELKSNFLKKDYIAAVKKAKEYIKKGDIYQVNLSQEFRGKTDLSGFEIYKRLRKISPAYFNAYLDCGSFQILSSSPERFLKLEGNLVSTRPMKGTRPRAKDRLSDERLKKELLESAKDKAELAMIVDLERNDLGKVCSYNSVRASPLRELEKYSTVFQTTATVSGRLHKNKDRIDLLRACFPGGSITGCPKIRAMEIIKELEPSRRLIYTGCLGYFSFSGGMDFNILIRTILKKEGKFYFGTGAGIVADSDPEREYRETLVKAKAMIEAIS